MFSKIYSADSASANKYANHKSFAARSLLTIIIILGVNVAIAQTSKPTATRPAIKQHKPDRTSNIELLSAIPKSVKLAYVSFADGGLDENNGKLMTTLLATASMTGLLSANQQIIADSISAAVTIGDVPHAIFLLDTSVTKLGPGSYTLGHLNLGLVIKANQQTQGKYLAFIKQTLDHYFTADNAKLAWTGKNKLRRQQLTFTDQPDWCCCEWGNINDTFIFSLGPNAYETIAKTVLKQSHTFNSQTLIKFASDYDTDIEKRMLFLYADFDKLAKDLRPAMGSDYDDIFQSFADPNIDSVLISAGFTNRAFISKIYQGCDENYQLGYLTGDFLKGDWRAKAVPQAATSYGVSESIIPQAISYVVDTYLASKNPKSREKLIRNYNRLAKNAELGNVLETLFPHFGPMVITHDWPKHPMGLSIAKTMLIEHDQTPNLKADWDKTMRTWSQMLRLINSDSCDENNDKEAKKSAFESFFNLQLDRTPDGIWFVHVGPLVIIAAGLDDNFLVLSYAIPAVQANLCHLKTVKPIATTLQAKPRTRAIK
jgi:hypothetical protein